MINLSNSLESRSSEEDEVIFILSLNSFFVGKRCCMQSQNDEFMYFLFEFNLVELPWFVRSGRYSVNITWILFI